MLSDETRPLVRLIVLGAVLIGIMVMIGSWLQREREADRLAAAEAERVALEERKREEAQKKRQDEEDERRRAALQRQDEAADRAASMESQRGVQEIQTAAARAESQAISEQRRASQDALRQEAMHAYAERRGSSDGSSAGSGVRQAYEAERQRTQNCLRTAGRADC